MSSAERKAQFFALMRQFNELGLLLPAPGDLDTDDVAAIAEARLVIAEMNKTRSEMDALLELERREGQDVISLSDNNSPGRPPRMKRSQFLERIAAMLALRGRGHFDDADVTDAVSRALKRSDSAAGGVKLPNDAIISVGETVGVASLG